MPTAATHPSAPPLSPPGVDAGTFGRAALLALLAHAALITALSFGVHWRLRSPEAVYAAELWSAVPQVAAPAPVEPPATPPPVRQAPVRTEPRVAPPEPARPTDAQIAIEKAERQRQQDLAREAELRRQQKAREDKARDERLKEDQRRVQAAAQREAQAAAEREAKADEERLARQREANLARIRGQAGATGAPTATGNAAQDAAPSAAYAGRIKARIKPNIVLTAEVSGNPVAEVEVRCAPDGTIVGRRVVKGSGNPAWDDTVLRAIDRTEVLPRDVDGRVPPVMLLVFPRRE